MRRVLLAGVLAVACLLLTGCLKIDVALTVNRDDTVSGTAILAVDKRVAELTGQSEEQLVRSMIENSRLNTATGTHTEPYSDSTFVGVRVIYDHAPLTEVNPGTPDSDALRIVHADERYTVSGVLDLSNLDLTNPALRNLGASLQVRIAITMPGRVLEHNGSLNGRTVTWQPKAGERLVLHAVSQEAGLFGFLTGRGLLVGGIGVTCCLFVTLILAGLIFWLLRRSGNAGPANGSAEAPPPSEHSPAPTADPSNPPPW
jgi:hypothetical protein